MERFRVDLHIHTLLSPCGDLGMSPETIVRRALASGLDAIAICDHNTTLQTPVVRAIGRRYGLEVFYGAELTTREEAHLAALLPDGKTAARLQAWIDAHIVRIPNRPDRLGDQMWVDELEMIVGEVPWYLNAPLRCSAEQAAAEVVRLGGLVIAAHVDRPANSLIGQLGFLPEGLSLAALEYNHSACFKDLLQTHPDLCGFAAYTASDAHFPEQIGANPAWLYAENPGFEQLSMAFAGLQGRRIVSTSSEP